MIHQPPLSPRKSFHNDRRDCYVALFKNFSKLIAKKKKNDNLDIKCVLGCLEIESLLGDFYHSSD